MNIKINKCFKFASLFLLSYLLLVACDGNSTRNTIPVALSQDIILNENTSTIIELKATDVDGDDLTYEVVHQPQHGAYIGTTYTPELNYRGMDSFSYKANDSKADSLIVEVSITVNRVRPTSVVISKNPDVVEDSETAASFDIEFSEDVTGFSEEDLIVSGGTIDSLLGSGSKYTLSIIPNKNSLSPISIQVVEDAVEDSGSDGNITSNLLTQNVNTQIPFITTWKTDNKMGTYSRQIKISTFGTGYDYKVKWGDGKVSWNVKGDTTHTYQTPGVYIIKIYGDFPRLYFSTTGIYDNYKLLSVEQWGTIQWESMENAFFNCNNLVLRAEDTPDLTNVKDMSFMFSGVSPDIKNIGEWDVKNVEKMDFMFYRATSFNQDINNWDTRNVKSMKSMFLGASKFNKDISSWNVENVTNMSSMFESAYSFDQPIGSWNTKSVVTMDSMFKGASNFNGDIAQWDTINVKDMSYMFQSTRKFNQDISGWNTSNVKDMRGMFDNAIVFNQDIGVWDTKLVQIMSSMFSRAVSFDQNISAWDVAKVVDMKDMFFGVFLSKVNFDALSNNWPLFQDTDAKILE